MVDETMGNPQATEAEIGWLAGIIDGEGHIGISRQGAKKGDAIKTDLQIVNTDWALIQKVIDILRKLGVNPHVRERVHVKKTWNTNWIVSVGKFAHIRRVLEAVRPHLTGIKSEKADCMLDLIRSRMQKTRADRYDLYEVAIVEQFRSRFVGTCGASTTAREARTRISPVKIQSGLA
jgi:signal recognition particle subunit SEC65